MVGASPSPVLRPPVPANLDMWYNRTMQPKPVPNPIRTTSANAFAHATMTDRLPANIRNVIRVNDFPSSISTALEELARHIAGNEEIPPPPFPAWDHDTWNAEWKPHRNARWHDMEWFFGETYGFRLLLERTRYFETGIDPFLPLKQREIDSGSAFLPIQRFFAPGSPAATLLETSVPAPAAGSASTERVGASVGRSDASVPLGFLRSTVSDALPLIKEALHLSMWGNKADISFVSGGELDHSSGDRELLILDHSGDGARRILNHAAPDRPVHIIMDNSGAELAGDLVLAMVVVAITGARVILHPKLYPTYVSDTTAQDIHRFLRVAANHQDATVRCFAGAMEPLLESLSITIAPDDYWCTARFMTDMPPRITRLLSDASVIIVKGDFNYRRVMRDTVWPAGIDPRAASGIPLPVPFLLLRTLKSDCLVGVPKSTASVLDTDEPGWRTAGRRGVIQLVS